MSSSSSTAALKKLSPQVLRELKRHVQPAKTVNSASAGEGANANNSSLKTVLWGCLALTGMAGSIPLIAHWWIGGLVEKDDSLTPAQVRRGAFVNSGSRDVGKDPNWDFSKGVYTGQRSGYAALTEEEKRRNLPNQYMALPDQDSTQERRLEAFAKGREKLDGRPTDY